jgi:hypothetical protein
MGKYCLEDGTHLQCTLLHDCASSSAGTRFEKEDSLRMKGLCGTDCAK